MLIGSFIIYDIYVQKRNNKVVAVAAKTNEIVASLFPDAVRDRLFEDKQDTTKKNSGVKESDEVMIRKFLTGNAEMDDEVDEEEDFMYKSKPIADLYPETTISTFYPMRAQFTFACVRGLTSHFLFYSVC